MSSAEEPPAHDSGGGTHTAKAVGLVLVAAILAVVLLHHRAPVATRVVTPRPTDTSVVPASTTTVPVELVGPAQIRLQVLNGTGAGNLAGQESTSLAGGAGYHTLPAGNTTSTVATSAIYVVHPDWYREGVHLARLVGLKRSDVHRGLPAGAAVPAGGATASDLVLVIGPGFHTAAGSSTSTSPTPGSSIASPPSS